jgi:hypothetical protein
MGEKQGEERLLYNEQICKAFGVSRETLEPLKSAPNAEEVAPGEFACGRCQLHGTDVEHDLHVTQNLPDPFTGVRPSEVQAPKSPATAQEVSPDRWPEIPAYLENPLVFRDANLGIVLVSGPPGDQMIWRKHRSEISGFHWCSVRKVDARDGYRMVDALNAPAPAEPVPAPQVTVEAKSSGVALAHSAFAQATPMPGLSYDELKAEVARLTALINTPEIVDFVRAVQIEAVHQRERWGSKQDEGKTAANWFWLLGYLAGKALHSDKVGDRDKLLHHVITTAAACANWHAQVLGNCDMRPGIQTPAGEK